MTNKTQCHFNMTTPAEKLGLSEKECTRTPTRNIMGHYEGRLLVIDFCEQHYQIMKEWLDS